MSMERKAREKVESIKRVEREKKIRQDLVWENKSHEWKEEKTMGGRRDK